MLLLTVTGSIVIAIVNYAYFTEHIRFHFVQILIKYLIFTAGSREIVRIDCLLRMWGSESLECASLMWKNCDCSFMWIPRFENILFFSFPAQNFWKKKVENLHQYSRKRPIYTANVHPPSRLRSPWNRSWEIFKIGDSHQTQCIREFRAIITVRRTDSRKNWS